MKIRELNLNSLVVFSGVYRTLSMTLASKELGMTQPGVTQHVRNIEKILALKLFHRSGKKLIPTKEAEKLYEGLASSLASMEELLSELTASEQVYKGSVRIGVPIEFGNSLVLPGLSKLRAKYPDVSFYITYGMPHELTKLLMEGKLDFAFVDQYTMPPAVKTEVVYQENLILCCTQEYLDGVKGPRRDRATFESMSFVEYQPGEYILRDWFERAHGWSKMKLKVAAYCFDVQGIAALVTSSLGVGVLPEHVFQKVKESGVDLYQFRSRMGSVKNPISLAYLEERWSVPLNQVAMTELKSRIKKPG